MVRKFKEIEYITNAYDRGVNLKKRRIVLVKKAMQLSILAGCHISLNIYCNEDGSLMEYTSGDEPRKTISDHGVLQYVKF